MAQNWWGWPFGGGSTQQEPLSGDVSQLFRFFSPTVTVNGSGDPALEGEIVRDVATYGSQLGQLNAIVLALATGRKPPKEAVDKLQRMVEDIEVTKDEYRRTAAGRARKALVDLKRDDPAAFAALLAEFRQDGSNGALLVRAT